MYPVYYCFSLALVLAAIGVQDRVLLVHMDNPGVPSTSLYCTLAGFDGIILFRSTSDPESLSESEVASVSLMDGVIGRKPLANKAGNRHCGLL